VTGARARPLAHGKWPSMKDTDLDQRPTLLRIADMLGVICGALLMAGLWRMPPDLMLIVSGLFFVASVVLRYIVEKKEESS
jgi:hypothetical protein